MRFKTAKIVGDCSFWGGVAAVLVSFYFIVILATVFLIADVLFIGGLILVLVGARIKWAVMRREKRVS
jgi:hypothetical protein